MSLKYSSHDHYLDPETGVLRNRLGIRDPAILAQYEADYASVRSFELAQHPVRGDFDLKHLCAIHRHLFGDVYDWAGRLRDIDISKGDSFFAHHAHIETAANRLFAGLAAETCLEGLDARKFSARAAHYLGEINALHPFREGNGRAHREFINHLAYRNGFVIDWTAVSPEALLQAAIASFLSADSTKLADIIGANLRRRV